MQNISGFRRNIKASQRIEYGFYQFIDHFFGRKRVFKILGKRRKVFYENLEKTLKKSGEGKIIPIERRVNLSLKDFKKQYLKTGIPVVLEGAAKDWDCVKKWSLEYFKDLHGEDEIVIVELDKKGFPYENIKLADVIDNIRSGGKKYYRFYPLLDKHPEHLKDFDYQWLLERNTRFSWFDAFQVFIGGKDTFTTLHNANQSNLFVQVYGEKKWILYSHYHTMILDPDPCRNMYRQAPEREKGQFDPFNPNYEKPYNLYKYIDSYEVNLKPGDILWNPPYYWHTVKNTTDSIGVGYRWLSPLYAMKIAPLYLFLDLFAKNPPFWKTYSLYKKDLNLIHLAEYGNLDKYLTEQANKNK
ncbi:MAG TPA: cupin-like domain-containing protein [Bacteroidia bacterium]|nr:cupin-like domain-containing protein [Bacteroidia bacterium]